MYGNIILSECAYLLTSNLLPYYVHERSIHEVLIGGSMLRMPLTFHCKGSVAVIHRPESRYPWCVFRRGQMWTAYL